MASQRTVRWSLFGVAFALLVSGTLFVVKASQDRIGEPERWMLLEAFSPDRSNRATVWAEAPWMSYDEYVVVKHAEESTDPPPSVVLGGPGLLLHWVGEHDLDIGFPVKSDAIVRASEKDGIHFRMVPYPDQPAVHDKWKRLLHTDPYPSSEMIDFERSPPFIDSLLRAAAYKVSASNVAYDLSQTQDSYGNRWCKLGFAADGGNAANRISAFLQAHVDNNNWVDFSLMLGVQDIRDLNLSRLAVTGAQFIGDGFATSMTEAQSFANRPTAEGEFTIFLFRQHDLERLLAALSRPTFKLAFLWDMPDTVVASEIDGSPSSEQVAAFFQCVGDANPAHYAGEDFRPFYRTLQSAPGG
jgi:hypothetical protein